MTMKTIGYVSMGDPFHDRKYWSGLVYKIREAIENAGYEVIWIPYTDKSVSCFFAKCILKCLSVFMKTNGGVHFKPLTKAYSKSIDEHQIEQVDYLFFPGGAQVALFLRRIKPIIYYTDATIFQMNGYYGLPKVTWSQKMAEKMEKEATNLAHINIRSSQWAINSVINDCGFDPKRSYVLEFGANVDDNDIRTSVPYSGGELRILFSGVDWNRKGGDIAVNTVRILRDKGINANLFIVGINKLEDKYSRLDYVSDMGFLNKNKPDEYRRYIELFSTSHIFLLPTRAECSAIVFCEASAFGLPIYTYLTGGTADYVVDGKNGRTITLDSSAEDFANKIMNDLYSNNLPDLHNGALSIYKEKLSWEVWSQRFKQIMEVEHNS